MDIGNIKISNRAMSNRDDVAINNSRRDKSIVHLFFLLFFLSFRISETSRCKPLCVLNRTSRGRRDTRFSIRLAHTRKNKRSARIKTGKYRGCTLIMAERHSRRTLVGGDAIERENRCNGDYKYLTSFNEIIP